MNNNVAGNLNNCAHPQNNSATNSVALKQTTQNIHAQNDSQRIDKSMNCLNSMGVAQVNMDNLNTSENIRKSLEEYMQNPELIEAYIDFCDSLIQRGHNLKNAIDKTDEVFEILHKKETYN